MKEYGLNSKLIPMVEILYQFWKSKALSFMKYNEKSTITIETG